MIPFSRRYLGFLSLSALLLSGAIATGQDSDVPALIKQLGDKDESVRLVAARQLGRRGADAKAAVPDLTKALSDSSPSLRCVASQALQHIRLAVDPQSLSTPAPTAEREQKLKELKKKLETAKVIERLKDKDEIIRLLAARELGKRGVNAKDSVASLTKALNDEDVDVRHVASVALQRVQASLEKTKDDGEQRKALSDLQKKLDDAQNDKKEVQKKLDDAAKRAAQARTEHEREIARLKDAIQDLNRKLRAKK